MSPEKLFDYLDGTLAGAERAELERDLAINPTLQRELAIARQIHKGMGTSREVVGTAGEAEAMARAGATGRKVATAFAALVLLNVLAGMFFIVHGHQTTSSNRLDLGPREAAIRQQLSRSIEATAAAKLPDPKIGMAMIELQTAPAEADALTQKVIEAAARAGGSATRKFGEEGGVLLIVELPTGQEANFRAAISTEPASASLNATDQPTAAPSDSAKTFLQVRIRSNMASGPNQQ